MKKQLEDAFGEMFCKNCLEIVHIQSFEIFDPAAEQYQAKLYQGNQIAFE